jgi:hypothetical protein
MGLTIHYTITDPRGIGWKEAERLVKEMRRLALAAKRRGDVEDVLPLGGLAEARRWAVEFREWPEAGAAGTFSLSEILPERGWVFPVLMGDGCEPFWLGLCEYPSRVRVRGRELATGLRGWRFARFCKTQYASLHGWEHFRRCHLAIIGLLAGLRETGLRVQISDEGGYWPRRSERTLREKLNQMNRLVAAMGGALKDAHETEGAIQSPIFAHPQFERLEAEGVTERPDVAEAVRRITGERSTR